MKKEQVETSIKELFRKTVQKDAKIHNAYLLADSAKLGVHLNLAEGETGSAAACAQQPYYIASVSKLITSVLTSILIEKDMISYEDPISRYLEPDLLHNLHLYKGKDYTSDIKIKHLLNHTSGLHDFLEDSPKQAKSFVDHIIDEPDRLWTTREAIVWAKEHLEPHFPPGQGFHYSDTGYHLLGLIIEKITEKPYGEVLRAYIFEPLQMKHSYLAPTEPIEKSDFPLAHLFIRNINITHYSCLSFMHAGGGIVSTNEDLLKFMKALVHHEIISEKSLSQMKRDWGKFFIGIDYGYGVMNFKTIPVLMPQKYNVWGNAGSTGSFMFYHSATDTYLIGSLNHFRYNRKGIRLMLKTVDKLLKCEDI